MSPDLPFWNWYIENQYLSYLGFNNDGRMSVWEVAVNIGLTIATLGAYGYLQAALQAGRLAWLASHVPQVSYLTRFLPEFSNLIPDIPQLGNAIRVATEFIMKHPRLEWAGRGFTKGESLRVRFEGMVESSDYSKKSGGFFETYTYGVFESGIGVRERVNRGGEWVGKFLLAGDAALFTGGAKTLFLERAAIAEWGMAFTRAGGMRAGLSSIRSSGTGFGTNFVETMLFKPVTVSEYTRFTEYASGFRSFETTVSRLSQLNHTASFSMMSAPAINQLMYMIQTRSLALMPLEQFRAATWEGKIMGLKFGAILAPLMGTYGGFIVTRAPVIRRFSLFDDALSINRSTIGGSEWLGRNFRMQWDEFVVEPSKVMWMKGLTRLELEKRFSEYSMLGETLAELEGRGKIHSNSGNPLGYAFDSMWGWLTGGKTTGTSSRSGPYSMPDQYWELVEKKNPTMTDRVDIAKYRFKNWITPNYQMTAEELGLWRLTNDNPSLMDRAYRGWKRMENVIRPIDPELKAEIDQVLKEGGFANLGGKTWQAKLLGPRALEQDKFDPKVETVFRYFSENMDVRPGQLVEMLSEYKTQDMVKSKIYPSVYDGREMQVLKDAKTPEVKTQYLIGQGEVKTFEKVPLEWETIKLDPIQRSFSVKGSFAEMQERMEAQKILAKAGWGVKTTFVEGIEGMEGFRYNPVEKDFANMKTPEILLEGKPLINPYESGRSSGAGQLELVLSENVWGKPKYPKVTSTELILSLELYPKQPEQLRNAGNIFQVDAFGRINEPALQGSQGRLSTMPNPYSSTGMILDIDMRNMDVVREQVGSRAFREFVETNPGFSFARPDINIISGVINEVGGMKAGQFFGNLDISITIPEARIGAVSEFINTVGGTEVARFLNVTGAEFAFESNPLISRVVKHVGGAEAGGFFKVVGPEFTVSKANYSAIPALIERVGGASAGSFYTAVGQDYRLSPKSMPAVSTLIQNVGPEAAGGFMKLAGSGLALTMSNAPILSGMINSVGHVEAANFVKNLGPDYTLSRANVQAATGLIESLGGADSAAFLNRLGSGVTVSMTDIPVIKGLVSGGFTVDEAALVYKGAGGNISSDVNVSGLKVIANEIGALEAGTLLGVGGVSGLSTQEIRTVKGLMGAGVSAGDVALFLRGSGGRIGNTVTISGMNSMISGLGAENAGVMHRVAGVSELSGAQMRLACDLAGEGVSIEAIAVFQKGAGGVINQNVNFSSPLVRGLMAEFTPATAGELVAYSNGSVLGLYEQNPVATREFVSGVGNSRMAGTALEVFGNRVFTQNHVEGLRAMSQGLGVKDACSLLEYGGAQAYDQYLSSSSEVKALVRSEGAKLAGVSLTAFGSEALNVYRPVVESMNKTLGSEVTIGLIRSGGTDVIRAYEIDPVAVRSFSQVLEPAAVARIVGTEGVNIRGQGSAGVQGVLKTVILMDAVLEPGTANRMISTGGMDAVNAFRSNREVVVRLAGLVSPEAVGTLVSSPGNVVAREGLVESVSQMSGLLGRDVSSRLIQSGGASVVEVYSSSPTMPQTIKSFTSGAGPELAGVSIRVLGVESLSTYEKTIYDLQGALGREGAIEFVKTGKIAGVAMVKQDASIVGFIRSTSPELAGASINSLGSAFKSYQPVLEHMGATLRPGVAADYVSVGGKAFVEAYSTNPSAVLRLSSVLGPEAMARVTAGGSLGPNAKVFVETVSNMSLSLGTGYTNRAITAEGAGVVRAYELDSVSFNKLSRILEPESVARLVGPDGSNIMSNRIVDRVGNMRMSNTAKSALIRYGGIEAVNVWWQETSPRNATPMEIDKRIASFDAFMEKVGGPEVAGASVRAMGGKALNPSNVELVSGLSRSAGAVKTAEYLSFGSSSVEALKINPQGVSEMVGSLDGRTAGTLVKGLAEAPSASSAGMSPGARVQKINSFVSAHGKIAVNGMVERLGGNVSADFILSLTAEFINNMGFGNLVEYAATAQGGSSSSVQYLRANQAAITNSASVLGRTNVEVLVNHMGVVEAVNVLKAGSGHAAQMKNVMQSFGPSRGASFLEGAAASPSGIETALSTVKTHGPRINSLMKSGIAPEIAGSIAGSLEGPGILADGRAVETVRRMESKGMSPASISGLIGSGGKQSIDLCKKEATLKDISVLVENLGGGRQAGRSTGQILSEISKGPAGAAGVPERMGRIARVSASIGPQKTSVLVDGWGEANAAEFMLKAVEYINGMGFGELVSLGQSVKSGQVTVPELVSFMNSNGVQAAVKTYGVVPSQTGQISSSPVGSTAAGETRVPLPGETGSTGSVSSHGRIEVNVAALKQGLPQKCAASIDMMVSDGIDATVVEKIVKLDAAATPGNEKYSNPVLENYEVYRDVLLNMAGSLRPEVSAALIEYGGMDALVACNSDANLKEISRLTGHLGGDAAAGEFAGKIIKHLSSEGYLEAGSFREGISTIAQKTEALSGIIGRKETAILVNGFERDGARIKGIDSEAYMQLLLSEIMGDAAEFIKGLGVSGFIEFTHEAGMGQTLTALENARSARTLLTLVREEGLASAAAMVREVYSEEEEYASPVKVSAPPLIGANGEVIRPAERRNAAPVPLKDRVNEVLEQTGREDSKPVRKDSPPHDGKNAGVDNTDKDPSKGEGLRIDPRDAPERILNGASSIARKIGSGKERLKKRMHRGPSLNLTPEVSWLIDEYKLDSEVLQREFGIFQDYLSGERKNRKTEFSDIEKIELLTNWLTSAKSIDRFSKISWRFNAKKFARTGRGDAAMNALIFRIFSENLDIKGIKSGYALSYHKTFNLVQIGGREYLIDIGYGRVLEKTPAEGSGTRWKDLEHVTEWSYGKESFLNVTAVSLESFMDTFMVRDCMTEKRFDEGLEYVEKSLKDAGQGPCRDQALFTAGLFHLEMSRSGKDIDLASLDKARDYFGQMSHNAGSEPAEVLNNLGIAVALEQKDDEARAYYDKAIERDPKFADSYFNKGQLLYRQALQKSKEKEWTQALKLYGKALECYESSIDTDPQNSEFSWFQKGETLMDIVAVLRLPGVDNKKWNPLKLENQAHSAYWNCRDMEGPHSREAAKRVKLIGLKTKTDESDKKAGLSPTDALFKGGYPDTIAGKEDYERIRNAIESARDGGRLNPVFIKQLIYTIGYAMENRGENVAFHGQCLDLLKVAHVKFPSETREAFDLAREQYSNTFTPIQAIETLNTIQNLLGKPEEPGSSISPTVAETDSGRGASRGRARGIAIVADGIADAHRQAEKYRARGIRQFIVVSKGDPDWLGTVRGVVGAISFGGNVTSHPSILMRENAIKREKKDMPGFPYICQYKGDIESGDLLEVEVSHNLDRARVTKLGDRVTVSSVETVKELIDNGLFGESVKVVGTSKEPVYLDNLKALKDVSELEVWQRTAQLSSGKPDPLIVLRHGEHMIVYRDPANAIALKNAGLDQAPAYVLDLNMDIHPQSERSESIGSMKPDMSWVFDTVKLRVEYVKKAGIILDTQCWGPLFLAKGDIEKGDYQTALDKLEEALLWSDLVPEEKRDKKYWDQVVEIHEKTAECLDRLGQKEEADKHRVIAEECRAGLLDRRGAGDPKSAALKRAEAKEAIKQEDYNAAIKALEDIGGGYRDFDYWITKGEAYCMLGMYVEEALCYENVKGDINVFDWLEKCEALIEPEEVKDAKDVKVIRAKLQCYNVILAGAPNMVDCWEKKALLHEKIGEAEPALAAYDTAIGNSERRPDSFRLLWKFYAAKAELLSKDPERSREAEDFAAKSTKYHIKAVTAEANRLRGILQREELLLVKGNLSPAIDLVGELYELEEFELLNEFSEELIDAIRRIEEEREKNVEKGKSIWNLDELTGKVEKIRSKQPYNESLINIEKALKKHKNGMSPERASTIIIDLASGRRGDVQKLQLLPAQQLQDAASSAVEAGEAADADWSAEVVSVVADVLLTSIVGAMPESDFSWTVFNTAANFLKSARDINDLFMRSEILGDSTMFREVLEGLGEDVFTTLLIEADPESLRDVMEGVSQLAEMVGYDVVSYLLENHYEDFWPIMHHSAMTLPGIINCIGYSSEGSGFEGALSDGPAGSPDETILNELISLGVPVGDLAEFYRRAGHSPLGRGHDASSIKHMIDCVGPAKAGLSFKLLKLLEGINHITGYPEGGPAFNRGESARIGSMLKSMEGLDPSKMPAVMRYPAGSEKFNELVPEFMDYTGELLGLPEVDDGIGIETVEGIGCCAHLGSKNLVKAYMNPLISRESTAVLMQNLQAAGYPLNPGLLESTDGVWTFEDLQGDLQDELRKIVNFQFESYLVMKDHEAFVHGRLRRLANSYVGSVIKDATVLSGLAEGWVGGSLQDVLGEGLGIILSQDAKIRKKGAGWELVDGDSRYFLLERRDPDTKEDMIDLYSSKARNDEQIYIENLDRNTELFAYLMLMENAARAAEKDPRAKEWYDSFIEIADNAPLVMKLYGIDISGYAEQIELGRELLGRGMSWEQIFMHFYSNTRIIRTNIRDRDIERFTSLEDAVADCRALRDALRERVPENAKITESDRKALYSEIEGIVARLLVTCAYNSGRNPLEQAVGSRAGEELSNLFFHNGGMFVADVERTVEKLSGVIPG